jgi:Domain of unknown function (DUF4136)
MKKNVFHILMLLFLATSMAGCYPDGPDSIDEYDIVYTNYDDQFVFSGKPTYAMPDSVVKITGAASTGEPIEFVNQTYGKIICDRIKSNMASRGYTLVNNPSQADLVLFPSALEVTNITYYYDYWGYYYGWYYPGGGYYYPYYPTVTTYTTGSLIMTIADIKNVNPSGKNKVVWLGIINGLLEGSSTDFPGRINKSIDQAFTQSTYLRP